ncbi:MAG: STAS/SEC14 domain-containing protein [Cytophagaceae bacterium]|nr:STAS/SEC14 domain-containing protein [Cytophagaceae bacterium]
MMQKISSQPENMFGFRAAGEVTKEDFDQIVIPAINEFVERTGQLNYLLVIDICPQNFQRDF